MTRDQIHHDSTGTNTGSRERERTVPVATTGTAGIAEPTARPDADKSQQQRQGPKLAEKAGESARKAGENARDAARDATRKVRQQGMSLATAQKERAAEELSHFGNAIHRAAETLHEDGDHNIAEYADLAAERIDQATLYLRERNLDGLVDDAEAATRRRPELVYGGMFIAGLALSRFLKASGRSRRMPQRGESERMAGAY